MTYCTIITEMEKIGCDERADFSTSRQLPRSRGPRDTGSMLSNSADDEDDDDDDDNDVPTRAGIRSAWYVSSLYGLGFQNQKQT